LLYYKGDEYAKASHQPQFSFQPLRELGLYTFISENQPIKERTHARHPIY
jgi:hypothetical protein